MKGTMGETNQQNLKPGVQTSEFWLTLLTSAVGILVATGYLTPTQASDLVHAVLAIVGGATVVVTTAVYLYGRFKLKEQTMVSSTPVEGVPDSSASLSETGNSPTYVE